jgi:predicted lipoprotein with Yx(FWY)xxD motif
MSNPRIIAVVVAAVVAAGVTAGCGAASTGASSAHAGGSGSSAAVATVRSVPASVGGKSETVLVDAGGLPLYYYRPDTATKSLVSAGLAASWPPLISASPSASGLRGTLTVVHDSYGAQVAYNGHLLYTFSGDNSGKVTGQGIQDFYVATPDLGKIAASSTTTRSTPTSTSSGGYGY